MIQLRNTIYLVLIAMTFTLVSCGDDGVNIFTIEDDIMLGQQLRDTILKQPQTYPILDRNAYGTAYTEIEKIVDEILATGELKHAQDFAWEIYIIRDDSTLNAFVAPGGYIFVYTGIIKYLDKKDDFVGVMGHEMAHADRRHSTQQLTKAYGVSTLLSLVLGEDPGLLGQVLQSLVGLKFSRDNESEADEYSVIYLCETKYAANGAASFFEKLINSGAPTPPEFLSTHPSPDNRVEDINKIAKERGCSTEYDTPPTEWQKIMNALP